METEPQITHLLVCAAAQLGGDQPLACVEEIQLTGLEHTALVPAWVKVLCPNATKMDVADSCFPLDLPHPSMPHPHLQHLDCSWHFEGQPASEHIRQQLSALPSLSSLALSDLGWAAEEEDEQQARRLMSSTVSRLDLLHAAAGFLQPEAMQRLPTQFPSLTELNSVLTVDHVGLEALLNMPHLESFSVEDFRLERSHTDRTWQLQHLESRELDVESLARLPLESIHSCVDLCWVYPSQDAAAVARVALAVKRWGGLQSGCSFCGSDVAALLTTLGPLIAMLPAAQKHRLQIHDLRRATSAQVQQLGQQLPASITHLELCYCSLAADAWPALLPSLPASVVEVRLSSRVSEQQVVAMCQAAVRPIKVQVVGYLTGLFLQDLDRITRSLARGPGGSGGQQQQQGSVVTLVSE